MDETRIELLTANHERGTFDCGKSPLNAFIRQHASVNHERGVSRVYVAVRGTHQQVLAYSASSAGTFLRDQLPPDDQAGLPRYPLPTVHLGRLAVDLSCRGQRLGGGATTDPRHGLTSRARTPMTTATDDERAQTDGE